MKLIEIKLNRDITALIPVDKISTVLVETPNLPGGFTNVSIFLICGMKLDTEESYETIKEALRVRD